MGNVVPGCVEDGAWMLWGNYSVAVVASAVLARSFLDNFLNKCASLIFCRQHLLLEFGKETP